LGNSFALSNEENTNILKELIKAELRILEIKEAGQTQRSIIVNLALDIRCRMFENNRKVVY